MRQTKTITIVGYGSQGRSWALNLRDSGYVVDILLPAASASHNRAAADGFSSSCIEDQSWYGDLFAILIPDQSHRQFFTDHGDKIPEQATVVFAHGYSTVTGLECRQRRILVSPKIIGPLLRQRYANGESLSIAIGVEDEHLVLDWQLARELALDLGGEQVRIILSDFYEETLTNLFVEQTLLVGGLAGLVNSVYGLLVKNGINPDLAHAECFDEISYMADMIRQYGVNGMLERVSPLARQGALQTISQLFDRRFQRQLVQILNEIGKTTGQQSETHEFPTVPTTLDRPIL